MYEEKTDINLESPEYFIIKRSGERVPFQMCKITEAITRANNEEGIVSRRLTDTEIYNIGNTISKTVQTIGREISVEEIQDLVENYLMDTGKHEVAKKYIKYRDEHARKRNKKTPFENAILNLINDKNEEIKQENSNKNPVINSTQRDYMAGEVSKDFSRRMFLPEDIIRAHDEGIIHFHDMDYFAQHMYNCCLINLEDMLQNGTCISGTKIDPPKSFSTACTITSQIVAQVASNQYGGQTFTLSHLAPFVDISRKKIKKRLAEEFAGAGVDIDEKRLNEIVEKEVVKEVESGMQTIQYQLVTIMTTNGQAPFVTVFMYLNEVPEGQERDDLALIIKVMLEQRMLGVKDKKGVYITPAFPKLIYVLQEDNIYQGTPYFYLTELAARCTAKRLVPDYISEKVMRELKGDVYPCMGCVDGKEVVTYRLFGILYTESFERMWDRLSDYFEIKLQPNKKDYYMDTVDVQIYDQKSGFVENYRVIKNHSDRWLSLTFSNGRFLICTPDHPFETENRGVVLAEDLSEQDIIAADYEFYDEDIIERLDWVVLVDKTEFEGRGFSYDVTTESKHFTVSGIYSHNCRSFLTPDRFTDVGVGNIEHRENYDGSHRYYGRFNQGVVTLNLVDVACSSGKDMDRFWELMNERLELCHRALRCRHERLLGTKSDVAPILWQDGAIARLEPGETIDKLLYDGYSTISLGYAGLYECVYYMLGVSHTTEEGKKFGLSVMQALNDACTKWKTAENIDYSVYGTPLESTTYKFAKCLQKRFGKIENVTDRNYITNSYHCNVAEHISAFDKLSKESEFQKLSPGGWEIYIV